MYKFKFHQAYCPKRELGFERNCFFVGFCAVAEIETTIDSTIRVQL